MLRACILASVLLVALAPRRLVSSGAAQASERQTYWYEMTPSEQQRFLKKLRTVRLGESAENVLVTLGNPRFDEKAYTKEPPFRFIARTMKYYIKQWEKDLVNECKDQSVYLRFDEADRLTDIASTVPGAPGRKAATACPSPQ
jgi:hypothetical protein